MIDRDTIIALMDFADRNRDAGREIISKFAIEKAQVFALVRIGDILENIHKQHLLELDIAEQGK